MASESKWRSKSDEGQEGNKKEPRFDVCIVGSGPDALAVLSAIHEPFAQLTSSEFNRAVNNKRRSVSMGKTKAKKVCVISSSGAWLHDWNERFRALEISHLRSPASAHPDAFSMHSLLEFAREHNREEELIDVGVRGMKVFLSAGRIADADEGLFDIPSQALFMDFCSHLAKTIPVQSFVKGHVTDIDKEFDGSLRVHVQGRPDDDVGFIFARHVVLAIGAAGTNNVPKAFRSLSRERCVHTNEAQRIQHLKKNIVQWKERVLVVGGGLSAVQAAIACAKRGASVVLLTRRPLIWRHFDFPIEWFDRRLMRRKFFDFFASDMESRPDFIRNVRGGGSVPLWYRAPLDASEVEQIVGAVTNVAHKEGHVSVRITSENVPRTLTVDRIILGTGNVRDCLSRPLIARLHSKWPVDIYGGFPAIEKDLRWSPTMSNLFVVGSLASLRVGPSASNLMGARRGAETLAEAFGTFDGLEDQKQYDVKTNPYAALFDSDSDSDLDSDSN